MLVGAEFLDRGQRRVGIQMAGTTAVTQFTNRVKRFGAFDLLVLALLVIIGVTAGTIWPVCCKRPCNSLVVRCMAIQTLGCCAVVTRVIR